jgi:hypothetical protein
VTFPWVEASVRFGLVDRVDLQLRFDPSLLPEVDVGYQLVGDPTRDDDLAVTVTGGFKGSFLSAAGAGVVYVNLPLQLLADLPINESFGLMGGLRVIPNALFGFGGGAAGSIFGAAPGVVVGLRLKVGGFVLSPEFALASNFPVLGAAAAGGSAGTLGVGAVSGTFGFNIGGQFGTPERAAASPSSPSPAADAAVAPSGDAEAASPAPTGPPAPLDPAAPQ